MGYVRFNSEYYNTRGDNVLWEIEIYDTIGSGITLPLRTVSDPVEEYEGVPEDLIPGVYPTRLSFAVYMENGTHEGLITDLAAGDEQRFIVRAKKDGVLFFIGYILLDQCQEEDQWYPFIFNIVAADGLFRLGSEKYVPPRGEIQYNSLTHIEYDVGNPVPDTAPVTDGTVGAGTGWTMIEHYSSVNNYDPGTHGNVERITTYARKFQYAINSPGVGWYDQGGGLWTIEVPYTNETIINESQYYHLIRDIDDDPRRTIIEFFHDGLTRIGLASEYSGVMFDTASEWYESQMANFTDDPFGMERLHDMQFLDMTYREVFEEIAKLKYLRIYYCNAAWHFEQIPIKRHETYTRWQYLSDGTLSGTTSSNLDIDLSAEGIESDNQGIFKRLSPLRSVEATFKLAEGNLLKGFQWNTQYDAPGTSLGGLRYLGRIRKEETNHHFQIQLNTDFVTAFDFGTLAFIPNVLRPSWTRHNAIITVVLRVYNKNLGTTHYRQENGSWDTTYGSYSKQVELFVPFNILNIPVAVQQASLNVDLTTNPLPGNVGDLFEIHLSVVHTLTWSSQLGSNYFFVENPGSVTHKAHTKNDGVFKSLDASGDELNANQNRIYYVQNNVNNSLKVEFEVLFGDFGVHTSWIEVFDGTDWVKSNSEWSIGGAGDPLELIELLVREFIGLRMEARKIYMTEFLSSLPTAQSRLQKGGAYYIPLRASRNMDDDGFNGEFLQIARTTPPDPGVIVDIQPDTQIYPPLTTDPPDIEEPGPIVLETNEAITAGPPAITECAILNTANAHVPAGAIVRVYHPTSPSTYVTLTLTQAILPTSTVMYFNSVIWLNNYPDGSPIVVEPDLNPQEPTSLYGKFIYFSEDFTGSELHAPGWTPFPDTEAQGAVAINARIKAAFRDGGKIIYRGGSASDPNPSNKVFDLDTDEQKFLFPVPLVNESLYIVAE